jgi:prepilin-type N-terminal cleavage/methylation domain-containing protein
MIRRLSAVLRPQERRDAEAGFTVIEVMVAMLVFAVMSVGIAYGIVNSLQLTQNSRGRTTATALATQDIDRLRQIAAASTNGIFQVLSTTTNPPQTSIGGTKYTINRAVTWVQTDGSSGGCGATTSQAALAYKSVVETVTWTSANGGTQQSVTMTSGIAPADAVTDPSDGTILISVTDSTGAPNPGVAVSVSAISGGGGAALSSAPPVTDSQGCSYATNVQPGTYTISVSETGGIDSDQQQPSSRTPISVKAGGSSPVPFTYDLATNYTNVKYASNLAKNTGALMATNMQTTLSSSTGGLDQITPWTSAQTITSDTAVPISAFPFQGGYNGIYAGSYANSPAGGSTTCVNPNPSTWSTPNAAGQVGQSSAQIPAPIGAQYAQQVNVPMGAATIKGLSSSANGNRYITAVSATPATGDPGCNVPMTLTFPKATGTTVTVALPFGTWTLYAGTSAGATGPANSYNVVAQNKSNVQMLTNGTVNQGALIIITWNNTVTFDPRGM